jgi:hypothetical protein
MSRIPVGSEGMGADWPASPALIGRSEFFGPQVILDGGNRRIEKFTQVFGRNAFGHGIARKGGAERLHLVPQRQPRSRAILHEQIHQFIQRHKSNLLSLLPGPPMVREAVSY